MPEIDFTKVMAELSELGSTEARTKYLVDNNLVDWVIRGFSDARAECDILRVRLGDDDLEKLSEDERKLIAGFESHTKSQVIHSLVVSTELQAVTVKLLTVLCDDNATGSQRNSARAAARQFIKNIQGFARKGEEQA